jgi:hypothetical protein
MLDIPRAYAIRRADGEIIQAVRPFMDFIIISRPEGDSLYDASGRLIFEDFGESGFEILRERDPATNKTVFEKDGATYIFDPAGGEDGAGEFVPVSYNRRLGSRGVSFMYPSYYGARHASGFYTNINWYGRWAYMSSATNEQVHMGGNAGHGMTFNFSEGLAVAYQDRDGISGGIRIYNESRQSVTPPGGNYYLPPASETTLRDIGFYYFDHGLTRAIYRMVDPTAAAFEERHVLLEHKTDSSGRSFFTEFYTPEDYTVVSYSNGMILLEKNGSYGFMNYRGEWIAQPIYSFAQPFFEGVAVIGVGSMRALIDTQGNLLTRGFIYNQITNCTGGIIALYENNRGWIVLNKVRTQIEIN